MITQILLACMLSGTPTFTAADNKPTQEQKDTTTKRKPIVIIGGKIIIK